MRYLAALLLVIVYAIIGVWLGTSTPNAGDTFTATLLQFGNENKLRVILAFILVDVLTGVIATVKMRTFDLERLGQFYGASIVPYVFGYLLVWALILLGLDGVINEQLQTIILCIAFACITASLTASIQKNVIAIARSVPNA